MYFCFNFASGIFSRSMTPPLFCKFPPFLKRLIYFYWKGRYTARRRDREEDILSNDSLPKRLQHLEQSQSECRSQELPPGLPRRCRVPRLRAVLDCFPPPQTGSWMGSVAARTRISAHMGSWHVQGEDLYHYAIMLGPSPMF